MLDNSVFSAAAVTLLRLLCLLCIDPHSRATPSDHSYCQCVLSRSPELLALPALLQEHHSSGLHHALARDLGRVLLIQVCHCHPHQEHQTAWHDLPTEFRGRRIWLGLG